ncbi:MAG: orotate phosphoribosyltransferase [Flammeovirgaceae bacterium]
MDISHQVASKLLDSGAVKIQPEKPFIWASGWKSPIYCDNRLTLSYPEVRTFLKNALLDLVKSKFADVEAIAGVATAGIPQGVLIADAMNLPFLYVRSSPKEHGLENMIEGKANSGAKMVVVEDLISTGGSSLKAALALKDAGYQILGLVAIFTYGFDLADKSFAQANIPFYTLSNYSSLLDLLKTQGKIDEKQLSFLQKWKNSPETWGK